MKKIKENAMLLFSVFILIYITIFCLMETDIVKSALEESVMRCLTTVIPSLYAMLIVSAILINCGIFEYIPRITSLFSKVLLKMEKDIFCIYVFSQFAGYPVGAKMLKTAYENNRITKNRAELLIGVCFGAGPAFIFGCISSQLYSGTTAGKLILISSSTANFILAILISFLPEKKSYPPKKEFSFTLTTDTLTKSIVTAGRSMAVICFTIMAFSVLSSILKHCGIIQFLSGLLIKSGFFDSETANGIIMAFLDVTEVSNIPHNNYALLPVICALSSFGGICVLFQISTITCGTLSLIPMLILRFFSSIISGVICRILMPYFIAQETISADTANISFCNSSTPVPSILLVLMTLITFSELNKLKSL